MFPRRFPRSLPSLRLQFLPAARRAAIWSVLFGLAVLLGPSRPVRADTGSSQWSELARLQRQALRQNGLDRQRLRDLSLRLRLSALLPQLRATWGRGTQWAYSTRTDSYSEPLPDGDRTSYSLALSWDLSRLLFAAPELNIGREATRIAPQRTQLLLRVAALYLRRCQLGHADRAVPPQPAGRDGQAAALDLMLLALLGDEARTPRFTHCPADPVDLRTLSDTGIGPETPPSRGLASPPDDEALDAQ